MYPYSSFTDEKMLSLLKGGDRAAYAKVYHRYEAVVHIFFYKSSDHPEKVGGLTHEVFTRLCTIFNRYGRV